MQDKFLYSASSHVDVQSVSFSVFFGVFFTRDEEKKKLKLISSLLETFFGLFCVVYLMKEI